MIDQHIYNPKSQKYYVRQYIEGIKNDLRGKKVIDIPAGNGATTEILLEAGADVEPFDLFPEYFMLKGIECKRADITDHIPVPDDYADWVTCQEGIEHFSDQLFTFKEINRVLKPGGRLLLTTPSYSNLSAKLSYLLFESETHKQMPPNEIDDIWMADSSVSKELYHGHIFMIGLQKLRVLARLSGFRMQDIRYMRLSKGSLALFPFFYPFIWISSRMRYSRNMKKHPEIPLHSKQEVYREQLRINLSPKNLLNKHSFIIFEKEISAKDVSLRIENIVKPFGQIM
ncbi:MAG: class I SAM-dependent methyltransferase [Bacteroidetes bacterium]|nr:class I SAM-dependent methyltransferase [Bacteroidota bacterium]